MPQQPGRDLRGENADNVFDAMEYLKGYVEFSLKRPVQESLSISHPDIEAVLAKIDGILKKRPVVKKGETTLHLVQEEWPICKVAALLYRKSLAQKMEERSRLTSDPTSLKILQSGLDKFDKTLTNDWFKRSSPAELPTLTNFLNTQMSEGLLDSSMAELYTGRQYDEKFHILFAPEHFQKDLLFFRERCDLRNLPLVVAYMDIDDFKAFNTELGNTEVDTYVLPKLMFALESAMYFKGFAYRYGGDEYIATFPNCRKDEAASLMFELQDSCAKLDFVKTERQLKLSIGLFEVNPRCGLTNKEIEQQAERAKDHAKSAGEKNCVVGYSETGDLTVFARQEAPQD